MVPPTTLLLDREALALLVRRDAEHHVTILAATTGLLDQLAFAIRW